ncbi:hypothetical protein EMPS_00302 [Entomortierella parvispora]|uniref:C3HC-type domain-containing protein n=1 Tax=Entomortierella parvispora TaxID=205924 RepID=A0A9P3H0F3_9FUNG|nr:hypothetical protein EMPS_00302 [Entomortierella parvispora]
MDAKRKIDESLAILNSLFDQSNKRSHHHSTTGKNAASGTTSAAAAALPVKKQRVYLPPRPAVLDKLSRLASSRPTLKDSIAASIAASAPTTHRSNTSTGKANGTSSSTPGVKSLGSIPSHKKRFMPWSREQFHERLETFKPSTWFDKPKLVNAVECAKRGWINTADDRLECWGGCGGVVIVRIDQGLDQGTQSVGGEQETENSNHGADANVATEEMEVDDLVPDLDVEALGPKFHAMLASNHATGCPWKGHPCDDSIYKFPVYSQSQAKKDFVERAQQLKPILGNPLVETIKQPLSKSEADSLIQTFPEVTDQKLAVLALFGWQVVELHPGMLSCEACHTQCTFLSTGASSNTLDGDDDLEEAGDDGLEGETGFDVAQAHKWYCYWVDPEHDRKGGREGWKIFLELVTSTSSKPAVGDGNASSNDFERLKPNEVAAQIKRMLRGQVANLPSKPT